MKATVCMIRHRDGNQNKCRLKNTEVSLPLLHQVRKKKAKHFPPVRQWSSSLPSKSPYLSLEAGRRKGGTGKGRSEADKNRDREEGGGHIAAETRGGWRQTIKESEGEMLLKVHWKWQRPFPGLVIIPGAMFHCQFMHSACTWDNYIQTRNHLVYIVEAKTGNKKTTNYKLYKKKGRKKIKFNNKIIKSTSRILTDQGQLLIHCDLAFSKLKC